MKSYKEIDTKFFNLHFSVDRMVYILKFINSRFITDEDKLSAIQTVIMQYTPIDSVTKTDLINALKWLFEYTRRKHE